MGLLQASWVILRERWRRYLGLNLLIYSGVVIGCGVGALYRGWGASVLAPTSLSEGVGPGVSRAGGEGLIWLAQHWLVLAGCLLVVNLTLVSLTIVAGATWPPLLIPLGGWFTLELAGVTAVYAVLGPWSLLAILPLLVLEAQAVILGLFIGWGLGARKAGWRQRVKAWGEYQPVYLLIPGLLLAAGLWEAWIITTLIGVTLG